MIEINSEIELSIIATIYNDASIVPFLVDEILNSVEPMGLNFEIILVNDFSSDKSEEAIKEVCSRNLKVKGISLSRNYGQQIAMSAGIKWARGKHVVIMDGDLQNPPSSIPQLYMEILKGYDIVYAVSKVRNNFMDKLTSYLFWFILSKVFNVKVLPNQLMMKIMNRNFVDRFNEYFEIHRTVSGIVMDISSNFSVIEIENQVRMAGKSHYSFFARVNLSIDILISMSNAPLNIMIYLGIVLFIVTNLLSGYFLIKYFFFDVLPGYTSIILTVFFFGSLIVFLLGFIGRYLSNIYSEVRRRPLYYIKESFNFIQ